MAAKKPQQFLTAEQIVEVDDRKLEVVDVPEWGGAVRLRPLSLEEYWDVEDKSQVRGTVVPKERCLQMLRVSLVDEAGEPLFDEQSIRALSRKSFKATERLFNKIIEISDLTGELLKEAEAMFLEGQEGP